MSKKKLNTSLPGVGGGEVFNPNRPASEPLGGGKDEKTYIAGSNLIQNFLKTKKPNPTLFDSLEERNRTKVISTGADIEFVNKQGEGINFSSAQSRLIDTISNLLYIKSENSNKSAPTYLTGESFSLVPMKSKDKGEVHLIAPCISFTLYEITKTFYGNKDIGGENQKEVARLLNEVEDKKVLLRYKVTEQIDKKRTREHFIEGWDSLFKVVTVGFKDYLEGEVVDSKKRVELRLNPIFTADIKSKFVKTPTPQTIIDSYGSPKYSQVYDLLSKELHFAYSNRNNLKKDKEGHVIYEIYQEGLLAKIAPKYIYPKRRLSQLKPLIKKAVEALKNMGILLSYEIVTGKTGENKYRFILNKEY